MKTQPEKLVSEIAKDFTTYLRRGANFAPYTSEIDPNLNINGIEKLLRIHFVLTESTDDYPGVIDFVGSLRRRIRRIKTTVAKKSEELHGQVRGRIDWGSTLKSRSRSGFQDKTQFVCQQTKKNYKVPENLVLKRLLSVIYEIVTEDLKPALMNGDGYEWLDEWVSNDEELLKTLNSVFLRNVYLNRVELEEETLTDRTINSVKKSRTKLYREAAALLERYRKLVNYEIKPEEAKELLKNTYIKPEKTEVLFEFYWLFKILNSFEEVKFNLVDGKNNVVAEWEDDKYRYRIYHDSTGSMNFQENLKDVELPEEDGYLYRQGKVIKKWQEVAEEAFGLEGTDQLWGGRPDILLEKYRKSKDSSEKLDQLFIGEVKYTESPDYAAQGLKELLEYMGFVKDKEFYLSGPTKIFSDERVAGALFVDNLEEEKLKGETSNISIYQFGGNFEYDV